jgi:hypothetical protein
MPDVPPTISIFFPENEAMWCVVAFSHLTFPQVICLKQKKATRTTGSFSVWDI